MKQQSGNTPRKPDQAGHQGPADSHPVPPLPTVGTPLDGRQYQNIVEEQKYAEQRPTHEEQRPGRKRRDIKS